MYALCTDIILNILNFLPVESAWEFRRTSSRFYIIIQKYLDESRCIDIHFEVKLVRFSIEIGSLELFKYYESLKIVRLTHDYVGYNRKVAKYLLENYKIEPDVLANSLCNDLVLLNIILNKIVNEEISISKNFIFRLFQRCNLNTIIWLANIKHLFNIDILINETTIEYFAIHNRIDILNYFYKSKKCSPWKMKILAYNAAYFMNINIIRLLLKWNQPLCDDIIVFAVNENYFELVEWLLGKNKDKLIWPMQNLKRFSLRHVHADIIKLLYKCDYQFTLQQKHIIEQLGIL